MDDRSQFEPAYFSVPDSQWQDVGHELSGELARVYVAVGLALAELDRLQPPEPAAAPVTTGTTTLSVPAPAELALQMHEVAGQLLANAAGDEQDLRQIITTLRTALAVCWDLYSVRESERVTVAEHMHNLRGRIEDFERELLALRRLKNGPGNGLGEG
jgi:hypothetical protein